MDSGLRALMREVLAGDLSNLGRVVSRLSHTQNLDALWDLHSQYPDRRDLVETIGSILLRRSEVPADLSIFEIEGASFPQLTFEDGAKLIELGIFEVDYDEPLADKIDAAGFVPHDQAQPAQDRYDSCITQEMFPFQQTGKQKIRLSLVTAGKCYQCEEDFMPLMIRHERQKADHAMGLELSRRYPYIQRKLDYIMFGATGHDLDGVAFVLVLTQAGSLRWFSHKGKGPNWNDYGDWALVSSPAE